MLPAEPLLRWAGAVLILLAGAGLGRWGRQRLRRRVELLRGLGQGLLVLEQAMTYGSLPLAAALAQAAEAAGSGSFLFAETACLLEQRQGRTAGQAWLSALAVLAPLLDRETRSILQQPAAGLGWSDSAHQARSLELCRLRLAAQEEQALIEEGRCAKLWPAFGWGGSAVLILFLL